MKGLDGRIAWRVWGRGCGGEVKAGSVNGR